MVNYSFLSFLNLISSYSTRLCAPSSSQPYGALGIRIEIVLPLPPKMGREHCVTNKEPLQARIQAKRNILVQCKASNYLQMT